MAKKRLQKAEIRPISIGIPSGNVKMTLWAGTEDEEKFPIRCMKRGEPYVYAYGKKYPLTEDEIRIAMQFVRLQADFRNNRKEDQA